MSVSGIGIVADMAVDMVVADDFEMVADRGCTAVAFVCIQGLDKAEMAYTQ
jgi:hypothetical protein